MQYLAQTERIHMEIKNITDAAFAPYGRVLTGDYVVDELIEKMKKTPAPDHVIYIASDPELEKLQDSITIAQSMFGGMSMQVGYCNGTNHKLDAVEYHRNSEGGVAVTDLMLIVGKQQDITKDFTYDTSKMEVFFVPAGTVYEMYATTLHYAPCSVDGKPFQNVVILPADTNTDLKVKPAGAKEDKILFATNKWLIAHEEAGIEGAFVGLVGENITLD